MMDFINISGMEKEIVIVSFFLFIGLLISNKIKPVILFFGLLTFYYLCGLLPTKGFLGNFTNESLITLVLLLLVSVALEKIYLIAKVAPFIVSGGSPRFALLKLSVIATFLSAFLNNTAVVAMLMGTLKSQKKVFPSKLLIPLSYFAILGGTLTLIGTSTNLVVNSFVMDAGLKSLQMFDFFIVGAGIAVVGTLVMVLLAPRLLPEVPMETSYSAEYFLEAKVMDDSLLRNKTVYQNGLRNLESLFLAEILRGDHLISPVSPETIVEAGDILVFTGNIADVEMLKQYHGLQIYKDKAAAAESNLVEAVVSHDSTLLGQTIKEADFRSKFDASVVALRRGDEKISGKIAKKILEAGDILVLAVGQDFYKRSNIKKNFYIVSGIETKNQLSIPQGKIALGAFILVVALSAIGLFSLLKGLLLLMGLYLLLGFIGLAEMKRLFPFDLVIIIGSALGIASTLSETGVAMDLSHFILTVFSPFGTYGSFIGVFLLTMIMTEFMTNNAAAALTFPIAMATATTLGVSPWPFIMAVAYGASASFISPYGYQTNLMVYSVGGYSLKDFLKIGLPVSLGYAVVALVLIPMVFPF
ncbi:MAG: SLC13 family permease [Sulfuricurvum sp.]